jgi:hypothetical protein
MNKPLISRLFRLSPRDIAASGPRLLLLAGFAATASAGPPASIAFAFSAKPEWYWSFWGAEQASGYREKMATTILPLAAAAGNPVTVVSFADPRLPDQMERDGAPWPFHQHLCRLAETDWLVSFRVADGRPVFFPWQGDLFSSREPPSAHWPELYWVTYDCRTGERNTARPILSPRRTDRYVFETELKEHARAVLGRIQMTSP